MIETVLGPVPAEGWGPTSTNEHLLTDSRGLARPLPDGSFLDGPPRLETWGDLRWNWMSMPDNLTLDAPDTAAGELAAARAAGLHAVVEATSWGMGPRHADLPDISRRSGVQIVAAYGSYIDKTLPAWWRDLDESEMFELFRTALTDAVPGTSFRAGLLGLLGTSAEITVAEGRALRAAGRAAAAAGASVSIRLDAAARRGPEVAGILTATGLAPERILFCNIDKVLDLDYVFEVVDTGAVVEFAFGSDHSFGGGIRDHTDRERLDFLGALVAARPDAAITLSCSVWTKGQLTRYGGMGYGHVLMRIAPLLAGLGVDDARLHDMLVARPVALLDRTEILS
ncbi:phosphotriesterase [Microbacterium sp. B19]|uniref:phosphotriesterase family protein n=1 Tax=Microbacterium sp. B19 TaxID=96765 RepID=UPI00034B9629|nr:phosphotriesterase [Microbacterium sp. B19]